MDLEQKRAFEERLARIGASHGRPPAAILAAGPQDMALAEGPRRRADGAVVLNDWRQNIRYPAAIVGAFVVGMISVFVARYVRFHLGMGGLAGEDADTMMLIDAAMGIGAGFVLRMIFHFEAKVFQTAQAAGVVAMIAVMHNFVHWAPGVFDVIFAPDWTREVITTTEPNSILFRGVTFTFDKPAEAAPSEASQAEVPQDWTIEMDAAPSAPAPAESSASQVVTDRLPQIH